MGAMWEQKLIKSCVITDDALRNDAKRLFVVEKDSHAPQEEAHEEVEDNPLTHEAPRGIIPEIDGTGMGIRQNTGGVQLGNGRDGSKMQLKRLPSLLYYRQRDSRDSSSREG